MKRLASVSLLAVAAATAVNAADLPSRKAPPIYEPLPPVMSWTGPYLGATVGGTFGSGSRNISSWGTGGGGCQAGKPLITTATSDPLVTTSGKPIVIDTKPVDTKPTKDLFSWIKKHDPKPDPKPVDPPVVKPTTVTSVGDPLVVDSSIKSLGNPCPTHVSASSVTTTTTVTDNGVSTATSTTETVTRSVGAAPLPNGATAALATNGNVGGSKGGFIGGLTVGYNYQFGNVVAGVEGDISGIVGGNGSGSTTGGATDGVFNYTSVVQGSTRRDYLATIRGRIGYLVMPSLLLYGTGGVAFGGVSSHMSVLGTASGAFPGAGWAGYGSYNGTKVGWTAGGGAEYRFSPNWSAKLEYLYVDLGSINYSVPFVGDYGIAGASQVSGHLRDNIVRVGVNWRPNW